jgi:TonB family protein
METFAVYFGKSALWITGFTLVFFIFLRNERFFILKRVYLIAGIIASLIFPLISFHHNVEIPANTHVQTDMNLMSALRDGLPDTETVMNKPYFKPDIKDIILTVYLTGIVFLAVKMIRQIKLLLKKIKFSKVKNLEYAILIRTPEFPMSFSFFNYIFISPSMTETEIEPVIKHELAHIRQKHWLDLMMAEILCLFQWMNPFSWIYSGYIRQNHEYIADQAALQGSVDPAVYKAVLLNQMFDTRVISLSNSFNYSMNKTRFEMMKSIITSPWRKLKILWVLPFIAILFYAFAVPEYNYVSDNDDGSLTIYGTSAFKKDLLASQNPVKENEPVAKIVSKTSNINIHDERINVQEKKPAGVAPASSTQQKREPIVSIDGEITDLNLNEAVKSLGYNMGTTRYLKGQAAIDKYGEKGADGVIEVITRKKALEMGLKPPFPRLAPEDYPTFQGKPYSEFRSWVIDHLKYPEEAKNKLEGWVSVNFQVELDGTVTNVQPNFREDNPLSNELTSVVKSSPKWDPPKNKNVDEPFRTAFSIKFILPDQISREEPPYVVVQEMPLFPGGQEALLNYIKENLKYPDDAKRDSIQGRVIVRFAVTKDGDVEQISVLKGVHPLLDKEAIRVVSTLPKFKPGMQGGKPVAVWYMIPVNFDLSKETQPANP